MNCHRFDKRQRESLCDLGGNRREKIVYVEQSVKMSGCVFPYFFEFF